VLHFLLHGLEPRAQALREGIVVEHAKIITRRARSGRRAWSQYPGPELTLAEAAFAVAEAVISQAHEAVAVAEPTSICFCNPVVLVNWRRALEALSKECHPDLTSAFSPARK
jgi:hypothetical protein